ncbi:MAG: hypothetical protein V8S96_02905 [Lachnospiraceae bacterium]
MSEAMEAERYGFLCAGLWLLSVIVNSGAGAMDASGSYTQTDRGVVDAYQYGKPRSASYEGIGTAAGAEAAIRLSDEAYWGGAAGTAGTDEAKKRASYLVKTYTEGTAAARLAGKEQPGRYQYSGCSSV